MEKFTGKVVTGRCKGTHYTRIVIIEDEKFHSSSVESTINKKMFNFGCINQFIQIKLMNRIQSGG